MIRWAVVLLSVLMITAVWVVRPAHAYAQVAFDQTASQYANPDGSFPVGAPVKMIVDLGAFGACSSARINWGDGSSDTGTASTYIVHFSHQYSGPGTYQVSAVDLCDGTGSTGFPVRIAGAGIGGIPSIPGFSLDSITPSFIASIFGIIAGAAVLGRAVSPSSGFKGGQGAGFQKKGKPIFRSKYPVGHITSPATPPSSLSYLRPSPIEGGQGYSVDTGRYIGPPPPPPEGQLLTGLGAGVAPVDVSFLPFLHAVWNDGIVTLTWDRPQFDPNRYALIGFDVFQLQYGPNSTAPVNLAPLAFGPDTKATVLHYSQTFTHNTGGDIAGYKVEPVYSHITPDGSQVLRGGGLVVKFGAPEGMYGL